MTVSKSFALHKTTPSLGSGRLLFSIFFFQTLVTRLRLFSLFFGGAFCQRSSLEYIRSSSLLQMSNASSCVDFSCLAKFATRCLQLCPSTTRSQYRVAFFRNKILPAIVTSCNSLFVLSKVFCELKQPKIKQAVRLEIKRDFGNCSPNLRVNLREPF